MEDKCDCFYYIMKLYRTPSDLNFQPELVNMRYTNIITLLRQQLDYDRLERKFERLCTLLSHARAVLMDPSYENEYNLTGQVTSLSGEDTVVEEHRCADCEDLMIYTEEISISYAGSKAEGSDHEVIDVFLAVDSSRPDTVEFIVMLRAALEPSYVSVQTALNHFELLSIYMNHLYLTDMETWMLIIERSQALYLAFESYRNSVMN